MLYGWTCCEEPGSVPRRHPNKANPSLTQSTWLIHSGQTTFMLLVLPEAQNIGWTCPCPMGKTMKLGSRKVPDTYDSLSEAD